MTEAKSAPGSYGRKVALLFAVNAAFYLQNLLLLPLFTHNMGVEMYGVWSQLWATANFLAPLALMGLPAAFLRFASPLTDRAEVARHYYTALGLVCLNGGLAALVLAALAGPISRTFVRDLDSDAQQLYRLAAVLIVTLVLSRFVVNYFRTFQRAGTLAAMRLAQPIGSIGLALAALILGTGLEGVMLAFVATHLLVFISCQIMISLDVGFCWPDTGLLRPFLIYCLPMVPASLLSWVTGLSDRYVIGAMMSVSELGIYSAGYTLGMVVMFFYAPFRVFVQPRGVQLWQSGDHERLRQLLNYSNKYPMLMSLGAIAGALALHDRVLLLMTGEVLQAPALLIPTVAVGYLFLYVATAYAIVFEFIKKTGYLLRGHLVAAILNVVANICLVPVLGIMGAAVGTVLTFLALFAYSRHKSRQFFDIGLKWDYLWKGLVAAVAMYGALVWLGPVLRPLGLVAELAASVTSGALLYGGIVLALGGMQRQEIDYLRRLVAGR